MKPYDGSVSTDQTWITYVARWATSGNNPGGSIELIGWPSHQGAWNNSNTGFATAEFGDELSPYSAGNDLDGQPKTLSVAGDSRDTLSTTASMTISTVPLVRPLISDREDFRSNATSYAYTYHSGAAALRELSVTTTLAAVSKDNHGSGTALTTVAYMRPDGSKAFVKSTDGIWTYTKVEEGLTTERLFDADLTGTFPSGDDPNGDFGISESSSGNELELATTYSYDHQGRLISTTLPDGRETALHYTSLADGRLVTLSVPKVSGGTSYGPASYTVTNQKGKVEAQGTIAFSGGTTTTAMSGWIDTGEDTVDGAVQTGALARLSTNIYDDTGTEILANRVYYDISGAGYDATTYDYDAAGRLVRTEDPTGTITAQVRDVLGRVTSTKAGTDDSGTGTDNMVTVSAQEYDGGDDNGDSLVTSRTLYVEDGTTGQRVTSYIYDQHDRLKVQINPESPHEVLRYDNDNHVIARGRYSDSSGLTYSTNPVSTATNRIGLSETVYDETGRVCTTKQWEVDPSDGSLGDSLDVNTWYGPDGRVAKVDGAQLTKLTYTRDGLPAVTYTLASDDDETDTGQTGYYIDQTGGPGGDVVMLEQQNYYDAASRNKLMDVSISRFHDDTSSTGALDPDTDMNIVDQTGSTFGSDKINGRSQITAHYFDSQERKVADVALGTYGGSDYNRDSFSTVPTRSDTVLVTSTTYGDVGSVLETTDPAGIVTRFGYDDAGRTTSEIHNYVNGTPGDGAGDDDQTIEYQYTHGLRTAYIAALPGGDQETDYTFGVTASDSPAPSAFASNRLLRSIAYPDSTGASDTIRIGYNAQGQIVTIQDQAGNVVDTTYDDSGRRTGREVTTLASGFDGSVRAIRTAYNSRGLVESVTSYSSPSSTDPSYVVDQLKSSWDGWGQIETVDQDFNSEGGASGSVDDWEVAYTRELADGGRNALRVTQQRVLYTGATERQKIEYSYGASGSIDDNLSRVSAVSKYAGGSPVTLAEYAYLGAEHLVGTDYVEPSDPVFTHDYGSTTGDYPALDRFNRAIDSAWSKDVTNGPITFYNESMTRSRVGDITVSKDNVYTGWDTSYSYDDLRRLTQADSGTWSGSSITSPTRQEVFELDQAGNWDRNKLDLNGDGDYVDTGEFDVTASFNDANEQTVRDSISRAHDAMGNLTDNGVDQKYVWDAFGRLCQILDQSDNLIAEYRYNGLNEMIAWHFDADLDGTVESNDEDPYRYALYNNDWQLTAVIVAVDDGAGTEAGDYLALADNDPKELYVHQAAGFDGLGGSSAIDGLILRDADMNGNGGWFGASDGTLEQRTYSCQNAHGDVVEELDETGARREGDRYFAYGMPFGLPRCDMTGDGKVDTFDFSILAAAYGKSAGQTGYDVRADINLDGSVDSTDYGLFSGDLGQSLGRGALTRDPTLTGGVGNRLGDAGYMWDDPSGKYQVRQRWLDPLCGRWLRRDPLGFVDGASLYQYGGSRALNVVDSAGLLFHQVTCSPYAVLPDADGSTTTVQSWCSGNTQPGLTVGGTNTKCTKWNKVPNGLHYDLVKHTKQSGGCSCWYKKCQDWKCANTGATKTTCTQNPPPGTGPATCSLIVNGNNSNCSTLCTTSGHPENEALCIAINDPPVPPP